MLTHPTIDLLHTLGLYGMVKGFKALEAAPETRDLEHAEWLGLLLDHEVTLRRQKRFERRARAARLRHQASVEDVDFRAARRSVALGPNRQAPANRHGRVKAAVWRIVRHREQA